MKRSFFFVLLLLSLTEKLYAFDISGLQPLAPNGVFSTFSAESLQKNKSSVELEIERSKEPDFYRASLRAAYGLSDKLEFNLTIPYDYHYSGDSSGIEDVALGFKYRFYDEGKYGPSLAGLLEASIPSGVGALTSDGRVGLGFIVSKRIGPFDGHFNIFYEKSGTSSLKDEVSLRGGVEFAAAHNFKILSEVILENDPESLDKKNRVEYRFGYRIKTTERIYTTFGAGVGVDNRNPEYRIFFSVNITTPREKKHIEKFIEEE